MGNQPPRLAATLTIPNGLSVARLLGVPLFLWLVLGPEADGWALLVLALSGFSDWLDGWLARMWRQTSRLGELLDPAADRAYIVAVVVGLTARGTVPLWFAAMLLLRDVVLFSCGPVLRRHGYGPLPVHFFGKAATFNLLYAFPLLLLGGGGGIVSSVAKIIGWAFAIWGAGLYWWAVILYVVQVRRLVRLDRTDRDEHSPQPRAARAAAHSAGAELTQRSARESARQPTRQDTQRPTKAHSSDRGADHRVDHGADHRLDHRLDHRGQEGDSGRP